MKTIAIIGPGVQVSRHARNRLAERYEIKNRWGQRQLANMAYNYGQKIEPPENKYPGVKYRMYNDMVFIFRADSLISVLDEKTFEYRRVTC